MLAHKKQRLEAELLQAALSCRGILSVVDATRDLLCAVLPYRPFRIKPNNHELGEIFVQTLATGRLDDRRYLEYTDIKVVWGRPVCPSHFGYDVIYSL